MRSLSQDSGVSILTTVSLIQGGSSSSAGIFSDGTPFLVTRVSTGIFDIRFDVNLLVVSAFGNVYYGGRWPSIDLHYPGYIRAVLQDYNGGLANLDFRLILTCLDKRL